MLDFIIEVDFLVQRRNFLVEGKIRILANFLIIVFKNCNFFINLINLLRFLAEFDWIVKIVQLC